MARRVFLTSPVSEIGAFLGISAQDVADTPSRRNIVPGDKVVAITQKGMSEFRWGIIPMGRVNARGRPVMETIMYARSETVFEKSAFDGVGRAVLPVNGWYEWTGETGKKTVWEITSGDSGLLFFAAITDTWAAPGGLAVPQLAIVTCAPSRDLVDIHHRMAVILNKDQIHVWLQGDVGAASQLMQPYPERRLSLRKTDPARLS